MEKLADAKHPIHDLLRQRWSPRVFADKMVEPDKLRSCLEAARWAPSCFNEQPWSFLVATKENKAEYDRLLSCLVEFNQSWAKTAPVLMISVASLKFARNGKPNRHGFHDVGLAVENMVIQALSLGLLVHQMAGFDLEKTRSTYAIPDGFDPVAAIAMGYIGDPQSLPEDLRKRELEPRTRKGMESFVFTNRWGQKAPWVQ
jgi:nitroreductase